MWYMIDKTRIQRTLNDFAMVIGLPISFFDTKKTMVLSFNKQQEFCKKLQSVPENLVKCWECDWQSILESEKRNAPYIYTCHAGLSEVVIPVKIENRVMSYVMFGEFVSGGTMDRKWEQIIELLDLGNLDKHELKEKFMKLKHFPDYETVHSYIRLFSGCMQHCVCEGFIRQHYPTKLEEALELVQSNLHKPINVNSMATKLNISSVYLNTLMNREMGISPGRFIIREKMKKAALLLSNDCMSITEVAHRVGVQDLGYFSRVFKKTYGVTPTEFGKQTTNDSNGLEFRNQYNIND